MKSLLLPAAQTMLGALLAIFFVVAHFPAVRAEEPAVDVRYEYGPDSVRKEGVPQGTITEPALSALRTEIEEAAA